MATAELYAVGELGRLLREWGSLMQKVTDARSNVQEVGLGGDDDEL